MNYQTLKNLLPNDELHFIDDCEIFFNENPSLYDSYLEDYEYILFENTIFDFNNTIDILNSNNIKYTIHTDSYNLDFIII